MIENPTVLEVQGDRIVGRFRILALLWTGATTSGDIVQLNGGNAWEVRTDGSQTYLGISFAPHGLPIQDELILTRIDSGKVLVYFVER